MEMSKENMNEKEAPEEFEVCVNESKEIEETALEKYQKMQRNYKNVIVKNEREYKKIHQNYRDAIHEATKLLKQGKDVIHCEEMEIRTK